MDGFITWEILKEYTAFVAIVFMIVEFTKGLYFVNKIPTKYWSALITFILLIVVNLHGNSFTFWDLVLYVLSSISISLGANGLANFNKNSKQ